MRCYLCSAGHHFRRASARCPIPGCNAEVRPTRTDPREDAAPAFHNLPRLAA